MAAVPFKVKSLFDYASPHEDDLNFSANQIITVTEVEDDEWYIGEYPDHDGNLQSGLFPKNFVERFEPEVPHRPSRSAKQKTGPLSPDIAAQDPQSQSQSQSRSRSQPVDEPSLPASDHTEAPLAPKLEPSQDIPSLPTPRDEIAPPEPAPSEVILEPTPRQQTASAPPPRAASPSARSVPPPPVTATATAFKGPPPPVSEKPSSFKDRIAAFNKQSTPVKPFDPKSVSNNVAKKPFMAPPPSKDAYVPIPKQEPVSHIYRREEDPEIIARQKEEQLAAEQAGLASREQAEQNDGGDAPKPQSLKDRIAMLQAQQREQAERRAELASKEKPPKPPKVRSQSTERPPSNSGQAGGDADPVRRSEQSERSTHTTRAAMVSPPMPSPSLDMDRDANNNDGNEADQSTLEEATEVQDETSDGEARAILTDLRAPDAPLQQPDAGDEQDTTEGETEEETEEQAEARRKQDLRERMAKMSGGMGMLGMFGPQPGMPPAAPNISKPKTPKRSQTADSEQDVKPASAPMVPLPGMASSGQPPVPHASAATIENETGQQESSVDPNVEEAPPRRRSSDRRSLSRDRFVPPHMVPDDRTAPPIPSQRPVPPMPPADDRRTSTAETQPVARSHSNRSSRDSTTMPVRSAPPPLPALPPMPQEIRPADAPKSIDEPDEGQSEYEGDYDTDIGSSDKHKAALKSHLREPSVADSSTTADEMSVRSITPAASPPVQHRAPPPLPPLGPTPTRPRESLDTPRAAPPPVPQQTTHNPTQSEALMSSGSAVAREAPPPPPPNVPLQRVDQQARDIPDESSDDLYRSPEPRKSTDKKLQDRAPPPPPPATSSQPITVASPRTSESGPSTSRRSMDAKNLIRRSMDMSRPSFDGHIACDVDLGEDSSWWAQERTPPPVFQGRSDILYEVEQSSASRRGGKTTISKDVYVLFQDYSQTVVTARYDSTQISDVSLEQRHEAPPARLRQDQLETYWQQFGLRINEAASQLGGKKDSPVGDGSPNALILELFKPLANALLPVGTRAYGALIYANMANASVQQYDEIRPGDIITLRNARMQGKAGGLHQKYTLDVGMAGAGTGTGTGSAGHVAIVIEWDGTKKKVRALEQGREKNHPRIESFRVGDLKSGEVKVWRVVGRDWVGWDSDGGVGGLA